ncbi:response regulator [Thalassospira sp. GO-4]|jgi:CheY-like chemotaxis protein|uniref:response regulator n=1 Tax=Thalassospira sp. GO-4 TaxID=2946605 RepID=UPI002025236E|nr:response regulator [Thalassospira sp. GO-4]URK19346.1 response regulator [Thalassospira sp. GO-4]
MSEDMKPDKAMISVCVVIVALTGLGSYVVGLPVVNEVLGGCVVLLTILAFYCIFRNTTQSAEREHKDTRSVLQRELVECIYMLPVPALAIDSNHQIIGCNGHLREIIGLSSETISGLKFDLPSNGKEGGESDQDDDEWPNWLVSERQSLKIGRHTISGTVILVPLRSSTGEGSDALVIIRPEEDLGSIREPVSIGVQGSLKLNDDDRMLLRELSHDMRSRFQNASGILDLAEMSAVGPDAQRYFSGLQKIYREAADRADSVISFFELDFQVKEGSYETFGIDELLNDISFALGQRKDIEDNEILFDTDLSVEKAIKYHKKLVAKLVCHLVLHVIGGEVGKTVLIRVRMTDSEDKLPELSVEVLTKDKIGGGASGGIHLDLEIARRIAPAIGGELFLDHQNLEMTGLHFQASVEGIDSFRSGFVVPAHLKNLQALIVDDNETSRTVFEQLTSALGWTVDVAASGEAAMHMIRFKQGMRESYDVILIDWRMPGMDGWQTSEEIRKLQNGGKVPIIVMISAHNRTFLSKNIQDRGRVLNGFLTKPVTLSMLLDAVADATAHVHEPVTDRDNRGSSAEPLSGNTVLIVDDNQMHREVAKEFMIRNGAQVYTASGGYEAISKVQNYRDEIDIVLMDVQMPDLNGFDAVKRIRELGYQDIPVLMMTANSTSELHHRSLQSGANEVVIKPFVMREIVMAMSKYVGRARQFRNTDKNARHSVEAWKVGRDLGFNADVIEQRFDGQSSTYVNSLKTFVRDAKRLTHKLEIDRGRKVWEDIVRETTALGGLLSVVGAVEDSLKFKQHAEMLQKIQRGETVGPANIDNALQDVGRGLIDLLNTRIAATEQFLEQLEEEAGDEGDNEGGKEA